ncbi:conjugative transposon protein TraN [Bacteroides uniformis]|nr:conjugative transposon protein TraN [Bacteroides uniformis]
MGHYRIHRLFFKNRLTYRQHEEIYLSTVLLLCVQSAALRSENGTPRQQAISQKDIFISFDCVKHLVFPVQVSDIAIGEQELVMASRVEEAPHIVALGASGRIHRRDQLTVVCIDGSVYTYHIRYLPEGGTDSYPNIYEDNGKWQHHDYRGRSQRPPSGRVLLSEGHRLRNARQRGVLHSGRLQQPVESINRQRCRGIFQPVCGG